ncbi:MAG: RluA family pseudouridine synthase [Kiritimatiellia bacterium]
MPERQIDAATAERVPEILLLLTEWLKCSKRAAKGLLDQREVFINGRRVWMARHRIQTGDVIRIPDTPSPAAPRPDPAKTLISIPVLYSDDQITVVNKPPGIESTGDHGMVETYAARTGKTCHAVHRIDRDTSGCLLIAHDEATRDKLIKAFEEKTVHKIYEALVLGEIWRARTIHQPIDGLHAVSHVQPMKKYDGLSRVEVEIETGRTHQIRRHLGGIGHPVLGDKQYCGNRKIPRELMPIQRHMLHAARIAFPHPNDPERIIRIRAPHQRDFLHWAGKLHLNRPEDRPPPVKKGATPMRRKHSPKT